MAREVCCFIEHEDRLVEVCVKGGGYNFLGLGGGRNCSDHKVDFPGIADAVRESLTRSANLIEGQQHGSETGCQTHNASQIDAIGQISTASYE